MIRNVMLAGFAPVMLLALAGCGGGGGDSTVAGAESYNNLLSQQTALAQKHLLSAPSVAQAVTPISEMPGSGTLSYRGVAAIGPRGDVDYAHPPAMGDFSLRANMNSGTVTGSIDNFKAAPGQRSLSGEVTLTGGVFGNRVLGTHSGTVVYGGVRDSVSGGYEGIFLNDDAAALFGSGEGSGATIGNYEFVTIGERD